MWVPWAQGILSSGIDTVSLRTVPSTVSGA